LSCVCHAVKTLVGSEDVFQMLLLVGREWSATWPKEKSPLPTGWEGRLAGVWMLWRRDCYVPLMGVKLKFHGYPAYKGCSKVILLTTQRGWQTKDKWVVGQCCVLDTS